MPSIYVMGDVHGHHATMMNLLRDNQLVDAADHWAGGSAELWFAGDFFDRGPDGTLAVDTVMRLQTEAQAVGGQVRAVLGNHDLLLLSVVRFGKHNQAIIDAATGGKMPRNYQLDWFTAGWINNGGVPNDLARLTSAHIDWLSALPAMILHEDYLFLHADSSLYLHYGTTVEAVNQAFAAVLNDDDRDTWDLLLDQFSEHKAFLRDTTKARLFQMVFGGKQLIHGHTPIMNATNQPPEAVTAPYRYASGRCLNIDHGLYRGGPGFIHQLTAN